ncbi:MAG TPA: hypothetical protein PLC79_00805 [Phycisphaerae bacterium]|nr:hypothetical protein [Phycisphaerae bacterium]
MSQDDLNEKTPEPQPIEGQQPDAQLSPQTDTSTPRSTPGMKRLAVIGLAVSLVALAAAAHYYVRTAGDEPQLSSPYMCYECGYIETVKLKPGTSIETCPKCQRPTFRPAYKCEKCGTLAVLNEYRGLEPPTKCPKCGAEIKHGE